MESTVTIFSSTSNTEADELCNFLIENGLNAEWEENIINSNFSNDIIWYFVNIPAADEEIGTELIKRYENLNHQPLEFNENGINKTEKGQGFRFGGLTSFLGGIGLILIGIISLIYMADERLIILNFLARGLLAFGCFLLVKSIYLLLHNSNTKDLID